MYSWLLNSIRLPHKVLITTRAREFKADYPVEVAGMSEDEFLELVDTTAARLGVTGSLTQTYIKDLFNESEGHPYVAKILLGELAVTKGGTPSVKRVLASKENLLEALFLRTYTALPPAAQRVFLTLCSWRSHVPRLALEAALLRRPDDERIDVAGAADILQRSSLVEIRSSEEDGQEWLSVPLAAFLFGQKQLSVSPLKTVIEADREILQEFGVARGSDLARGLEPSVRRLVARMAELLDTGQDNTDLRAVLEYVGSHYPRAWLHIAEVTRQTADSGALPSPRDAVLRYLRSQPDDADGWRKLVGLCRHADDPLAEMHARVQLSQCPAAEFMDISDAVNRFNQLLFEGRLQVDSTEKRLMAEKLRSVMSAGLRFATATDLSRLAWLCIHLGDDDEARRLALRGLEMEPDNYHCRGLQQKLDP
jgi:hypothetical protein